MSLEINPPSFYEEESTDLSWLEERRSELNKEQNKIGLQQVKIDLLIEKQDKKIPLIRVKFFTSDYEGDQLLFNQLQTIKAIKKILQRRWDKLDAKWNEYERQIDLLTDQINNL